MARDLPDVVQISKAEEEELAEDTARCIAIFNGGRIPVANALAEEILSRNPRAARVRAVRAMCLMAEAQEEEPPRLSPWREAEGEFLRAELLKPDDPVIGRFHARFLIADGHLSAAAERLDRILVTSPRDPQTLSLLGRVRYDLGDENKAVDACFDLISLVPDDSEAHYILGQCRLRMAEARSEAEMRREDYRQAQTYFARYAALQPEDLDGPLGEARALTGLLADSPHEAKEAVQGVKQVLRLYDHAASLAPNRPEPLFGRGVVFEYLGQDEAARMAYSAALALDPNFVPALLNLTASCEVAGMKKRAVDYARRALALQLQRSERRALQNFVDAFADDAEASKR